MKTITIPKLTPKNVLQFFDFSKGQNSFDDPLILSTDFLQTARNVRINRTGQIYTRLGQTQIGNTIHATNPILGLYEYIDELGTKIDWAVVSTALYELVTATWTNRKTVTAAQFCFETFRGSYGSAVTSGTATAGSINTLEDSTKSWTVDAYKGKILKNTTTGELKVIEANTATVITIEGKWDTVPVSGNGYEVYASKSVAFGVNGTDKFKITASNTIVDLTAGNFQAFTRIAQHGNRLFGILNQSSRLWYSDLGIGENFPKLNFIDVQPGDGDSIQSIASAGPLLIITKQHSTHVLTGTAADNFALGALSATIGCIAPKSMVAANGMVFFLGIEGVYMTDGQSAPVLVSHNIKNMIDAHTQAEKVAACAIIDLENGYYMVTIGDETFVYDIGKSAWVYDDGYEPKVFCNAEDANGAPIIFAGDQAAGKVWQLESGNLDKAVSNITSVWETVKIASGKYGFFKRFSRGRAFFESSSDHIWVTLEGNVEDRGYNYLSIIDLYQDAAEWDVDEWDVSDWSSPATVIAKFNARGRGRYISFKCTKSDGLGKATFYGLAVAMKEKSFR